MLGVPDVAKLLLAAGAVLLFAGFILLVFGASLPLDRLPGDIVIRRGNATFLLPLATSLLISLILTALVNIFFRR